MIIGSFCYSLSAVNTISQGHSPHILWDRYTQGTLSTVVSICLGWAQGRLILVLSGWSHVTIFFASDWSGITWSVILNGSHLWVCHIHTYVKVAFTTSAWAHLCNIDFLHLFLPQLLPVRGISSFWEHCRPVHCGVEVRKVTQCHTAVRVRTCYNNTWVQFHQSVPTCIVSGLVPTCSKIDQ